MFLHRYFVEFLGTFFLSFVIFQTQNFLAIGLALALAVRLGLPLSGGTGGNGAFNPAVSVAFAYAGRLPIGDLVPDIIAQVTGGVLGYEVYKLIKNYQKEYK